MTSKRLVDPELLALAEQQPALQLSAEIVPMIRSMSSQMMMAVVDPPAGVRRTEHRVPGPDGAPDVRVLVYSPTDGSGARPALLHIHGGGYVMGAPEMSDARNGLLAKDLGCVVVSVDYRLAPETPYPGALEDCYAALRWLHAKAAELGVNADRIAVGGESAGGGLAAALALLARDRGEVSLIFQLLVYPMIDDRTGSTVETHAFVGQYVWTAEANRFGWTSLLGGPSGVEGAPAYAAAARASDLAGLPPTFIGVGALDLFLEENIDYARRLMAAGVQTELHVYPGAFHGFDMLAVEAGVSKAFARDYTDALKRALR